MRRSGVFCNAKQTPWCDSTRSAYTAPWARPYRAVRITGEIARAQRQVNTLLYRRVPGELVDEIEDEIIVLRARLMANDVALMVLVEQARRANEQRPERHRLDLAAAFHAIGIGQG